MTVWKEGDGGCKGSMGEMYGIKKTEMESLEVHWILLPNDATRKNTAVVVVYF